MTNMQITYGDPRLPERYWTKVYPEPNTGCWLWGGAVGGNGYSTSYLHGQVMSAHRAMHLAVLGPVPKGWQVDHVAARGCTSPLCVNPEHLEAVTQAENLRRQGEAVTACPKGHAYDESNTGWQRSRTGRSRYCKECNRARQRRA